MAGYHLYLKDSTFMKLIQKAGGEGKTMGRFLNDLLNEYAQKLGGNPGIESPPVCDVCGAPATRKELPRFVCNLHRRKGVNYTLLEGGNK